MSQQPQVAVPGWPPPPVPPGSDVAQEVRHGHATFGIGTARHEQAQLALLGQSATGPIATSRLTAPDPASPHPSPPPVPRRALPTPDPDAALAAIERLGTEVPGMLRRLDELVDQAIRRDTGDRVLLPGERPAKPGYPADELGRIDAQVEARRRALLDMRGYAGQVWARRYAPFVQQPRALHEQARALAAAAASVADLDEAYEQAEQPKDAWAGADADAYRARVAPQRRAAQEYAGLVRSLADLLRQAAALHAGVFVVVHQVVQRTVDAVRASNDAASAPGEQARRIDICRVLLEHLGTWLEVYATDGDWLGNARALGEQMERLTQQTGGFPGDRWPAATEDQARVDDAEPAADPNPETDVEPGPETDMDPAAQADPETETDAGPLPRA